MSPEEPSDTNNSDTPDSNGKSSAEQEPESNDDDEPVFLFVESLGFIHLDEGDVLRKQLNHLARTEKWEDAVDIVGGFPIVSIHVKELVKLAMMGENWNSAQPRGLYPHRDFPPGYQPQRYPASWVPPTGAPPRLNQPEINEYNSSLATYQDTPRVHLRVRARRDLINLWHLSDLRALTNKAAPDPIIWGFKTPKEHNEDWARLQERRRQERKATLKRIAEWLAQPASHRPGIPKRRREDGDDDEDNNGHGTGSGTSLSQPVLVE